MAESIVIPAFIATQLAVLHVWLQGRRRSRQVALRRGLMVLLGSWMIGFALFLALADAMPDLTRWTGEAWFIVTVLPAPLSWALTQVLCLALDSARQPGSEALAPHLRYCKPGSGFARGLER